MTAHLGRTHSAVDLMHDAELLPAEGWVRLLEAAAQRHRAAPDPQWPTPTWFEVAVRHAATLPPVHRLTAFQQLLAIGLNPNHLVQVEPIASGAQPWRVPFFFWAHTQEEWVTFLDAGAQVALKDNEGRGFGAHIQAHPHGLAGARYEHDGWSPAPTA